MLIRLNCVILLNYFKSTYMKLLTRFTKTKQILPFFMTISMFLSCKHQKEITSTKNMKFDKIEYHFGDASTPPMYHRSYTINLNSKEGKVAVNVYGTVIAEDTFKVDSKDWEELQKMSKKLDKPGTSYAEGATGTKSYQINLINGDSSIYKLSWDSMNKMSEDTEKFKEKAIGLVKNLDKLKETKYPVKKD